MPRVADIYSRPAGIDGIPNQTIESADYNLNVADVEADLNLPRPIVAGGTGATSASGARDNIDAEVARQVVTNYNAHVWEAGSFYSVGGTTGEPVAGHGFAGIAEIYDSSFMVLEAWDVSATPGVKYVKEKKAGVWDVAWRVEHSERYVDVTGDTMTGDLTISKATARLNLDRPDTTTNVAIVGKKAGLARWSIFMGGIDAESGSNAGSSFFLQPQNDAGTNLPVALTGSRATSLLTVAGDPTAVLGIATKQYVDSTTVSLTGDTMTGALNVTAGVNATSYTITNGALVSSGLVAALGGAPRFSLRDSANNEGAAFSHTMATGVTTINGIAGQIQMGTAGTVEVGKGFLSRAGTAGAISGFGHNFNWTGAVLQAWIDGTNIGNVTVTSDYRTKRDVQDLKGTWDTVKALRPISYTHADWMPAWELEARTKEAAEKGVAVTPFLAGDNLEHWGFIAHELQDTLLPTAATGHKDAEGIIQSPNLMPLIAALTKALQEAMARIEALEAA